MTAKFHSHRAVEPLSQLMTQKLIKFRSCQKILFFSLLHYFCIICASLYVCEQVTDFILLG